jgi:ATP-dependent DNA helicase RecG
MARELGKKYHEAGMPKKSTLNPRKMMESAVEVMRRSVNEPRTDGKASPLVGAVLCKTDGTVETACRGELRYGDHAEFTLLERKNRACKLDGAILFTTLEPCAPGARNHPKLSCAERIVLARIKEVWVGIEDPDPTVDRKGIKYLQDNGVTVHMFDRDLQDVICSENKDFIDQAVERAAAAEEEKKSKLIVLSTFEDKLATVTLKDFSTEALEQYRETATIREKIGSPAFNRRLVQQGLLKQQNNTFTPTGFGLLLFGKEPRTSIQHAGLLGTIHYPDGTEETRDFDGPMVLIPKQIEKWLKDKLPNVIDRSHMVHKQETRVPFELIREAVVNALVHRDYEIQGAKCQIDITADTLTVKSPGGPLPPVTLEQLQSFSAPMLSRNPRLQYVFAKMALANERGLGMKTLRTVPAQLDLPLPRFAYQDPYLTLTIFRTKEAVTDTLDTKILAALNEKERKGWQWLATKGRTKSSQYAMSMQVEDRTARRHLNHFVDLGLVRKTGSGPSTEYEVIWNT